MCRNTSLLTPSLGLAVVRFPGEEAAMKPLEARGGKQGHRSRKERGNSGAQQEPAGLARPRSSWVNAWESAAAAGALHGT